MKLGIEAHERIFNTITANRRFVKMIPMKTDELLGIARFKIKEGKLDQYKRLCEEALELVRANEPGTLQYDIYFNDDESECMVIEKYKDSEAAMQHAKNLAHIFEGVLSIVSVVHGEVLGNANPELKANLANSDVPVLFTPYLKM
jgi:quinol monooxygenase YgiN